MATDGKKSKKHPSPYIPDGYTLEGAIPAVAGRWERVKFTYRPMSADEESEILAQQRRQPGEKFTNFYAPAMAEKILDWDLCDHDGNKLPITAEVIRRLHPAFYDMLKAFIDGSASIEQEKN